jgi:hypothetical protein
VTLTEFLTDAASKAADFNATADERNRGADVTLVTVQGTLIGRVSHPDDDTVSIWLRQPGAALGLRNGPRHIAIRHIVQAFYYEDDRR